MLTVQYLRELIQSLEDEIIQLETRGDRLVGYWIDTATNRKGTLYHRLRWFEDGKRKARVLKDREVIKHQAMIDRGEQWAQLKRRLDEAKNQLQQVEATIRSLGGQVP